MLPSPQPVASTALLTLWLDAEGRWHATVVMPDGLRLEFLSPFELARWCRGATRPVVPATADTGLR